MTSTRVQREPIQAMVPFKKVCDLLGIHSNTGYLLRKQGTFPIRVERIGGRYACPLADVEEFFGARAC